MTLIAGFDAGQTHTTCRLAWIDGDGHWRALADGEGSGVSHLAAPGGEDRFGEALRSSLAAAVRASRAGAGAGQADRPALAAAAIGASGIEQGTSLQRQGQELAAAALALPLQRLLVTGDERTALRGALGGRAGVLVISGTGAIAVGQDAEGRQGRCGGWGWLLDGAGSAMDIGRDGLLLSVRMADGRLAETALRGRLWQELGVSSAQQLKARVVQGDFGPAGFARLARVVDALAADGDACGQAILTSSARALVELVRGVACQLKLAAPLVTTRGGAITHLAGLRACFEACLAETLPQARILPAAADACHGALTLAAELLSEA